MDQHLTPLTEREIPGHFLESGRTSGKPSVPNPHQSTQSEDLWLEYRSTVNYGCRCETEGITEGLSEPDQNGLSGRRPPTSHNAYGWIEREKLSLLSKFDLDNRK